MIDPGSFRDPAGIVLRVGNRILRAVSPFGAEEFEAARDSGLLEALVRQEMLVPFREIDPTPIAQEFGISARYVLEHPRLPFISYPYEWSFTALKAAAICHLEVHLIALEHGFTLSDATAFNIQFDGSRPIFIDHLSFRRYREGEYWLGHRQFCEQFLNPLLLRSICGIPHQAWYRGSLHGIPDTELAKILPWPRRWTPIALLNVTLPAYFQRKYADRPAVAKPRRELPRAAFKNMLVQLRKGIERLIARRGDAGVWADYVDTHSYAADETSQKKDFIHRYVSAVKPQTVWDLGCNTGAFARVCLAAGAERVIGFDNDPDTLDVAYQLARKDTLPFLPLHMDITNPTPSQGWRERERGGFASRDKPDGVIALALLHHLVVRNNVPIVDAIDWLMSVAPTGILEFVPKNDPMVQRLLALREDIFPQFTREVFLAAVGERAQIVEQCTLTNDGRLLVRYAKR